MTRARYKQQQVNRISKEYSGPLHHRILTEMDRELRRIRDILGDASSGFGDSASEIADLANVQGDILYTNHTPEWALLTKGNEGQQLRMNNGSEPRWSTNVWPDTTTAGDVLYASSGNTYSNLGIGSGDDVLGVNSGGTAPEYKTISGVANEIDISHAAGFITIGIVDPLIVAKGGTGRATSTTAYGLLAAGTTATGAHQTLAAGLTTQILVGGGASALPAWGTDIPTAVTIGSAYIYRVGGTDVSVADGGTGISASSTTDLFNQIDPLTTQGDLLTRDATNSIRLGRGTEGDLIQVSGSDVQWGSATGNIDFATFKAIAMVCDNGATLPTSPTPVEGQWFLHTAGDWEILKMYDGSSWIPIVSLGSMTIYLDAAGTDDNDHGHASGTDAKATLSAALDEIPGINAGNVTIEMGSGTFAGATIQGKGFIGNFTLTINGVLTVHGQQTINSHVLGTSTTQGTVTLGALPAGLAEGDIVVFDNAPNAGKLRVIDEISGTTLKLCGEPLSVINDTVDTCQFRPYDSSSGATIMSSSLTIGDGQKGPTIQYLRMPISNRAIFWRGAGDCTISQCLMGKLSGTGRVFDAIGKRFVISDCGIISNGTSIRVQNASSGFCNRTLIKGTGSNLGVDLSYGSSIVLQHGTVLSNFARGIRGHTGNATFFGNAADIFVKKCSTAGVNSDNQTLLTSGLLSEVVFGTGGDANGADFKPLIIETGIARTRTNVTATPYTHQIQDDLIAVTLPASARTINLLSAATVGSGKQIVVKDEAGNSNTHNITVTPNGSEKIDGTSTKVINTNYGSLRLYSNGSNWFTF